MKEFEALVRIMLFIAGVSDTLSVDEGEQLEKDIIIIGTYLTPPTSEEVCRAIEESYLSNVAEMGVIYDSISKAFRMEITGHCICEYDEYEKKINYHWIVTPELSILIGKFYQGVKE
jgi:hypothetical protein